MAKVEDLCGDDKIGVERICVVVERGRKKKKMAKADGRRTQKRGPYTN